MGVNYVLCSSIQCMRCEFTHHYLISFVKYHYEGKRSSVVIMNDACISSRQNGVVTMITTTKTATILMMMMMIMMEMV